MTISYEQLIVSRDSAEYGLVGVLYGGDSAEREVSLASGEAVIKSLQNQAIQVKPLDGLNTLFNALQQGEIDRVFNIMHGRGGEDGIAQGMLDACGVAYTGSNVLGSALAMDKYRSKQIWHHLGLQTPKGWLFDALKMSDVEWFDEGLVAEMKSYLPLVVKPNCEGSTVGLSVVRELVDLPAAIELAVQYDKAILIEQYIVGEDLTVTLLGAQALPSIRILPVDGLYDYAAKYVSNETRYECPALEGIEEQALLELSQVASQALGVTGWARVDVMRDANGVNWLLEVNTVPGMTSHSLVPMSAEAAGIGFDTLTRAILETSW